MYVVYVYNAYAAGACMQWISGVYDSQTYSFETGSLSILARLVPQRARGILLSVTQFWSACSQAKILRGVGDSNWASYASQQTI